MVSPEVTSNNVDDVQQPPFNEGFILVDSDSEEEVIENDGYMLLSQNTVEHHPDGVDDSENSSSSEEYVDAECESIPALVSQDEANFDLGTSTELRELWSAPATHVGIDLSADKVEAVCEAMANITLPASAIPEWAACVPEEQWKQLITARIQEFKGTK